MKNLNLTYASNNYKNDVVSFSGGIDSVVLLTKLLHEQKNKLRSNRRITAITFEPNFLSSNQINGQRESIKNYISWAKEQGYEIEHYFEKISLPPLRLGYLNGQGPIWAFLHCYTSTGIVHIGYIKDDSIWEIEKEYFEYIDSMAKVMGIDIQFSYDFADKTKSDIVKLAKEYKIPSNCYWFCESSYESCKYDKEPNKLMPCGYCAKCKEAIKAEIFDLDWYNELFNSSKSLLMKIDNLEKTIKNKNDSLGLDFYIEKEKPIEKNNKSSWKYTRKSSF